MHIQTRPSVAGGKNAWKVLLPASILLSRRRILTKLMQAEAFEVFLQTKYVGKSASR